MAAHGRWSRDARWICSAGCTGGNVRSVWEGEKDLAGQGLVGQTKGLEELTTHVFFCLVIYSFNIDLMNIQRTPGTLHVKSFKQETGACLYLRKEKVPRWQLLRGFQVAQVKDDPLDRPRALTEALDFLCKTH